MRLEFTPLEFETSIESIYQKMAKLEFTPLEFETLRSSAKFKMRVY